MVKGSSKLVCSVAHTPFTIARGRQPALREIPARSRTTFNPQAISIRRDPSSPHGL
jgi:hypothetical protein